MKKSDQFSEKSRRVAILSHCLLNQNSKPYKRARYSGVVTPLLKVLTDSDYGLLQMPCPEISFTGLNRFSQVVQQYDTPKYRDHCRDLAVRVVDQVEAYIKMNFQVILVGIEGSPSCGVTQRGSDPNWKGSPKQVSFPDEYPVGQGAGIFVQELREELKNRDFEKLPEFGVPLDIPEADLESIDSKIKEQLENLT